MSMGTGPSPLVFGGGLERRRPLRSGKSSSGFSPLTGSKRGGVDSLDGCGDGIVLGVVAKLKVLIGESGASEDPHSSFSALASVEREAISNGSTLSSRTSTSMLSHI